MGEDTDRIGVSLLSGGLDSTVVTAWARTRVRQLMALTFHYGQAHSKEVQCARHVAQLLDVHHELVDISAFGKVAWYSSLTSPDRFPLPEASPPGLGRGDRSSGALRSIPSGPRPSVVEPSHGGMAIPISYVPLRNTLFLAMAGALLESQVLYNIEARQHVPSSAGPDLAERDQPEKGGAERVEAYIYVAANAIDYSGYPDCRPEYYDKMRDALMYGSKLWTQYGIPIHIETPIIQMSKAEIVKLGMELQAPLGYTWSCYRGGEFPCARCDSCILRARGFAEAGYEDPLLARLGAA